MQPIKITVLLHSPHVLAKHGHHQVSATMLKLLHCTDRCVVPYCHDMTLAGGAGKER